MSGAFIAPEFHRLVRPTSADHANNCVTIFTLYGIELLLTGQRCWFICWKRGNLKLLAAFPPLLADAQMAVQLHLLQPVVCVIQRGRTICCRRSVFVPLLEEVPYLRLSALHKFKLGW